MDYAGITLCGRLGRDPERRTAGDKTVAEFSLAVGRGPKDKRTTTWFNVVAWEKLAELVCQHLHKGDEALVAGEPYEETWEKDGQKRSKMKVNASTVRFGAKAQPKDGTTTTAAAPATAGDEDLPF
jgi:single-strand DNA-binding protein